MENPTTGLCGPYMNTDFVLVICNCGISHEVPDKQVLKLIECQKNSGVLNTECKFCHDDIGTSAIMLYLKKKKENVGRKNKFYHAKQDVEF